MRHFVLAVAVLFFGVIGVIGVAGLSNAALQSSGELDSWALYNTNSNTWSKESIAVKSDNNEWTFFNTSTSYWKAEGDILPAEKHGIEFSKVVKTNMINKAFN